MKQCINQILFTAFFAICSFGVMASPLNGNYTIGNIGADFETISDATTALTSGGVSGPVVFNILPGVYNALLNVYNVAGVSEVNRITFRSSTGNPNDVILEREGTVCIIQVSYVTIESLTMRQLANWSFLFGPDFGRVLEIGGIAQNSRIIGNILIGADYVSTIQDKYSVISMSQYLGTGTPDNTMIIGNEISKGSVGIHLGGSALVTGEGLQIIGNTISDYRWYGIYITGQNAPIIKRNKVTAKSTAIGPSFTYPYAMILDECSGAAIIDGNYLQSPFYSSTSVECIAGAGQRGKIINNIIVVDSAATSGFAESGMENFDIFHNTVVISGRYGSSAALRLSGPFGGPSPGNDLRNNIFANFGEGVALGITFPNSDVIASDYNLFYSASGTVALSSTFALDTTLADWQAQWGLDLNSVEANPLFNPNFHINTASPARNLGIASLVSDDYDAGARDASPDAGADEFGVVGCDYILLSADAACPLANGTANIVPLNNSGIASYSWSDGSTADSRADLSAGTYTITATDGLGCVWTSNVIIGCAAAPAPVSLASEITEPLCFGDCTGIIDMVAEGGCLPFVFEFKPIGGSWQPASTSAINPCIGQEIGLCAGLGYGLRVTDGCGNIDSLIVDIIEPNKLIPLLTDRSHISCYEFEDGIIEVSAFGGTPPYLFSNNGGGDLISSGYFDELGQDIYPMYVEDANGCIRTGNLSINEPNQLLLSLVGTLNESVPGIMDGGLRVQASGGTGDKEYSINMGVDWQSSRTFPGLAAGNYTVWVQDENGCITELMVTVNSAFLKLSSADIFIAPNPAISEAQFSFNYNVPITTGIEVIDQFGRVRIQTEILKGERSTLLKLEGLASGLYFVQVQNSSLVKIPLLVID